MKDLKFHEYAMLFPPMSEEELSALQQDIEQNGLVEPVVLYEGKILDGRNRYTAALMLGLEAATVEYDGGDPLSYVVSKNMSRRHLDTSQRAMIAAKIANLPRGKPSSKSKAATVPVSQSEAAKRLNVSERSVAKAAKVLREGSEKVRKSVERGEKTVSSAAKELSHSSAGGAASVSPPVDDIFAAPVPPEPGSLKTFVKAAEKDIEHAFTPLDAMLNGEWTRDQCYEFLTKLDKKYTDLYDVFRQRINTEKF